MSYYLLQVKIILTVGRLALESYLDSQLTIIFFQGVVGGIVHAYFAYRVYICKFHLAVSVPRGCSLDMCCSQQQEQVDRIHNRMLSMQYLTMDLIWLSWVANAPKSTNPKNNYAEM